MVWCINIEKNHVLSTNNVFSHLHTIDLVKRKSKCEWHANSAAYTSEFYSICLVSTDWHHKSPSGAEAIAINRMKTILIRSTQDTLFDFHTTNKYAGLELKLLILQENLYFQIPRYSSLATNHFVASLWREEEKRKTHANYWQLLLFFTNWVKSQ